MTLQEGARGLVITWLPVEDMALLSLGVALGTEGRRVLTALLEGRPVYLAEGALEYKRYRQTAGRDIYTKFTGLERGLRELGIRRLYP